MIVVDTSVLSLAYRRGRTSVAPGPHVKRFARLVATDELVAIPGIVLQELLSGVRTEAAFRRLDDAMGGFPLLLATRATHVRAARIRSQCRARGIAASTVDCLIAGHALEADAALLTADADFGHIAIVCGLELVTT